MFDFYGKQCNTGNGHLCGNCSDRSYDGPWPLCYQGPQGIQGAPGAQGIQGLAGARGPTGATGPRGDTGEIGLNGPPGDTGPKGDTGSIGPVGPKGDNGSIGPVGAAPVLSENNTWVINGVDSGVSAIGPTGPAAAAIVPSFDAAAAQNYVVGQMVISNGQVYVVTTAPPSGTPGTSEDYIIISTGTPSNPTGPTGSTGAIIYPQHYLGLFIPNFYAIV